MKTWLGICLVLWGCGGDAENSTGRDASTGGESARGGGGGAESVSSTGGTDGGSAGSAGSTTEPVHPEEMDARQFVTFALSNETGANLFVPTEGWECDLFAIERWQDDAWQALHLGFTSVERDCLCPDIACDFQLPQVYHFVSSRAGDVTTFTWDARALVSWNERIECDQKTDEPIMGSYGVPQPVEAGRYRVTMGYELVAPRSCVEDDTGALDCFDDSLTGKPGFRLLCETAEIVTAEFQLRASDNAVVPVVLTVD